MTRVLVIDDDPDILSIVEGTLEVEGHRVAASTDPRLAVALAIEHAVDVVVLDVNMPEMSGYETLEALRGEPRTAELPVLFLSALGDSRDRVRGLSSSFPGLGSGILAATARSSSTLRPSTLRRKSGKIFT